MRLAIIAEKPALLHMFVPEIRARFPEADLSDALVCYPIFGWYVGARRFSFPRGLKWADYPYVGTPQIKSISFGEANSSIGIGKASGPRLAQDDEAETYLKSADVILLLMDADYGGIHLAARFLGDHFGTIPWERTLYPWIVSLTDEGRREAMDRAVPGDQKMGMISAGETRRYFDFNYIANSLSVIKETARRAGISGGVPSKYGLQLLYSARSSGPMSYGRLVESMSYRWKGSGRYSNGDVQMGSGASRMQIVDQLVADGYLDLSGKSKTGISENGRAFLSLLHPRCEDPDLPFRLYEWSLLPPTEARAKIDRYIRTFFGRQKTFLDASERI